MIQQTYFHFKHVIKNFDSQISDTNILQTQEMPVVKIVSKKHNNTNHWKIILEFNQLQLFILHV